MSAIFICSFSAGIDDLTRKQQADPLHILRILERTKRFSVFEATANDVIARTMTKMMHKGCKRLMPDGTRKNYGVLLSHIGGDYPWTKVQLTDGARQMLEDNPS